MAEKTTNSEHHGNGPNDGESRSSLIDLLVILARHKKWTFGFPIAAGIVTLLVVMVLPKWYTATTKIMPPQQSQSNAVAILGQLGALSGSATQALGLKNPSDIYVAMLKSRTLADKLIDRFELKAAYDEDLMVEARKELARNSYVSTSREGVITIDVEDKDPKRAAALANAYAEELRHLTLHLAITEAGQRRLFFESQLKKAKGDLTSAEVELKKFTEDSGLVSPQGQIGVSVAAAASLRAQIAAREIQLTAMRSFATEANPDIHRTLQELSGLRAELGKMEKHANAGKGDVMVPFGKAPGVGLEYIRRFRDVKYHETLFEVLAKQYEIARIDEAKDATLIQILDAAIEPERKSKPKRLLITLTVFLVAALVSMIGALLLELHRRKLQQPDYAGKQAELRRLLSWH